MTASSLENYTLALLQKHQMVGGKNLTTGLLVVVVAAAFVYLVDPTMFGLLGSKQGFEDAGMGGDGCPAGQKKVNLSLIHI